MNVDQTHFLNLILEKTSSKLQQANSQLTILEVQLQLALEMNNKLTQEVENLNLKIKSKDNKSTN